MQFCSPRCWHAWRSNVAAEVRSLWHPLRLDAPSTHGTTLHDVVTANNDAFDPVKVAESALFDEIVGDLTPEGIHKLSDHALVRLRERLTDAGFGPDG